MIRKEYEWGTGDRQIDRRTERRECRGRMVSEEDSDRHGRRGEIGMVVANEGERERENAQENRIQRHPTKRSETHRGNEQMAKANKRMFLTRTFMSIKSRTNA